MPWPNPTQVCLLIIDDVQCGDPHHARGWCARHYKRWERTGNPLGRRRATRTSLPLPPPEPAPATRTAADPAGTCTHPGGCERPLASALWCSGHLRRVRESGDPGPAEIRATGPRKYALDARCEVTGCGRPIDSRGLCKRHYDRQLRTGDPLGSISRQRKPSKSCTHPDGCDEPAAARGLCRRHYAAAFAIELAGPRPRCTYDDLCEFAVYSQDLCRRHYQQGVRDRQRAERAGNNQRDANPREPAPSAA